MEQWQRVEELFHATLAIAPEERAAYLSNECGEDEPLRLEVESLISAYEVRSNFIDEPALSLGMGVLGESLSGSLVGRSLGHYHIIRLLGEGGMGEVYLAEDTVLERQVALKFIAGSLIDNELARTLLLLEARAVAKLEHPNICTVHEVNEIGEHLFIVMQFVEGETLSSVLRRGAPGIRRALEWAEQLAGVLTAAHARGIIHRDIKPHNIMVTPEGQLKVLDFGLAKFTRQVKDDGGQPTGPNTQAGVIAGTAAYMSPEQKLGKDLDGRTDIFSFGIVLCEMLGWSNPSQCETDEATIVKIKAAAVNLNGRKKLRAALQKIVIKCLRKDRQLRYEAADQLRLEIQRLRESLAPTPWKRLGWLAYTTAAIVLVVTFLAGMFFYRRATRTYTLAILPIVNVAEEQNGYLSTALTHTLADKFSYLPRLKVKTPSLKPKKDEKVDALAVARTLQVEAILTGELSKQDQGFKLHLRLLDTASGSQTWEDTFTVNETDLLLLEDEIAKEVTSKLGIWLVGDEMRLLARRQTDNRQAFADYTRGRQLWEKRDRKNMQEAIRLFEQATEIDPTFAKAFAGLADCFALTTGTLYGPNTTQVAMNKASYNANKAVELDPSLPEAHTSAGIVAFLHSWDWQGAEQKFIKAIEIRPDYAPARFWYSNLLAAQKRFDEAIKQGELAKKVDPYSQLAEMNYGRALYYTRRYDDAAAHFDRLLKQQPDYAQFMHIQGWVQIQRKQYDEAISILTKLYERNPLHAAAALGYAYARAGKKEEALKILGKLDELEKTFVVPPAEKALIYIGLGDLNAAFRQLEICYTERNATLAFLTTDPLFDPLRGDRRFVDLANRLKLPV